MGSGMGSDMGAVTGAGRCRKCRPWGRVLEWLKGPSASEEWP